jgi:diacylglycerol kinase (ATP)
MKSTATGIKRLILATKYSWQGLKSGLKSEAALRQEAVALIVLIPLAFIFEVSTAERALLLFSALFVFIVELLNSSLEAVVDRVGDEYHELSGKAKDLASAAVTFSLITVALVWGVILWPKILTLIN